MVRTGDLFFELFDDPVAVADPTTIITQYEFQQTFILKGKFLSERTFSHSYEPVHDSPEVADLGT